MTSSGLHFHGVWDWRGHRFEAAAAGFGASFLKLQKAMVGMRAYHSKGYHQRLFPSTVLGSAGGGSPSTCNAQLLLYREL